MVQCGTKEFQKKLVIVQRVSAIWKDMKKVIILEIGALDDNNAMGTERDSLLNSEINNTRRECLAILSNVQLYEDTSAEAADMTEKEEPVDADTADIELI